MREGLAIRPRSEGCILVVVVGLGEGSCKLMMKELQFITTPTACREGLAIRPRSGGCTLVVVGLGGGVLQTHDERTAVNNHPAAC